MTDTTKPRTHELKTWPGPFAAILDGTKPYEVRKADRPFAQCDTLRLREWDPAIGAYTGRQVERRVTYLTPGGQWGLPDDLCVLGLGAMTTEYERGFAAGVEAMRGEAARALRAAGTTSTEDLARRIEALRWDHPLPGLRAPALRTLSPASDAATGERCPECKGSGMNVEGGYSAMGELGPCLRIPKCESCCRPAPSTTGGGSR